MSDFEQKYRKWHTKISYAKSGIRFGACSVAMILSFDPSVAVVALAAGLLVAEVLGVLEEIF